MIHAEGLNRLALYNLDDVYDGLGYEQKRQQMSAQYAPSLDSLRLEIKTDPRALALYRGITRFMLEDATGPAFNGTKSALLRDSRRRAYSVIQRSRAWSELVDDRIEHSVRLSIHPQQCRTSKFGIRLLRHHRQLDDPLALRGSQGWRPRPANETSPR